MLDSLKARTYEEIQRATIDGQVDFDVLDRQAFEDVQDELLHPKNSDRADNLLTQAFTYNDDSDEMTDALVAFMNSGSLDSAQALRERMQKSVDAMTRDAIEAIAVSIAA